MTVDAKASRPLRQFLAPLPPAIELQLSIGEDRAGHEPITALPRATIEAWLIEVGCTYANMDAKTRASYLVGDIAWAFATNLAALHLAGDGLPDIDPDMIATAPQWYGREGGEQALRFTLRLLAAPEAVHTALDLRGIHDLAVAVHRPLIEALFGMTRLGRSAMWRLVADALAAGWLTVGKQIGAEHRAMQIAQDIIQLPGSPLANKQIGFVEIIVRDEGGAQGVLACEWFRARGGCCRYYTTKEAAGEYCTTCVLRPAASRDQRLYDHVKGKLQVTA